ncbi:MAG: hypothetical protein AAF389_15610 [Gemmatimonadota bacterium]
MSQGPDSLDALLAEYDSRKQDETRRMVQRAYRLENARKIGSEHLRRAVLAHSREVAERLEQAGHGVLYQELLDAYPPAVRLHLSPKTGAMDFDSPRRWTMELIWSEPDPDRLIARRWTSDGPGTMHETGSVAREDLDELWVREQFTGFVRDALDLH